MAADTSSLYTAHQVDESQRVNRAGGTMAVVEGVEAVTLPVGSVHDFIADDSLPKSPGLCFALLWALTRGHDSRVPL